MACRHGKGSRVGGNLKVGRFGSKIRKSQINQQFSIKIRKSRPLRLSSLAFRLSTGVGVPQNCALWTIPAKSGISPVILWGFFGFSRQTAHHNHKAPCFVAPNRNLEVGSGREGYKSTEPFGLPLDCALFVLRLLSFAFLPACTCITIRQLLFIPTRFYQPQKGSKRTKKQSNFGGAVYALLRLFAAHGFSSCVLVASSLRVYAFCVAPSCRRGSKRRKECCIARASWDFLGILGKNPHFQGHLGGHLRLFRCIFSKTRNTDSCFAFPYPPDPRPDTRYPRLL